MDLYTLLQSISVCKDDQFICLFLFILSLCIVIKISDKIRVCYDKQDKISMISKISKIR